MVRDLPGPTGDDLSTFAVRTIYLGDTERDGGASPTAWQHYGYDLDSLSTTGDSIAPCRLMDGVPRSTQLDGVDGIDNSFGAHVLPILEWTWHDTFAIKAQESFSNGDTNDLAVIRGLGADEAGYRWHTGAILVSAPLGHPPAWQYADIFDVDRTTLQTSSLDSALLAFDHAYVSDGVFVAFPVGSGWISIGVVDRIKFELPVTHALLTMRIAANASYATGGVIAGIIPTESFISFARDIAGHVSPALCEAQAFDSIAQQLRQASDIRVDGRTDPSLPCDGISFGIGFEATRVILGSTATVPPLPDACPILDAGTE
jgi:hypothetical protein